MSWSTSFSIGWVTLIFLNQIHLAFSLPFRQVSEFSLFQHSFVTVEDLDEGVLYQPGTPPNNLRQFDTKDVYSPTVWGLLSSCHHNNPPTSSSAASTDFGSPIGDTDYQNLDEHLNREETSDDQSDWCLFGKRVSSLGRFSEEIDKMRSIDAPLAHSFRSHLAMELLSKLLKNANAHQISSADDQFNSIHLNSPSNRLMQATDDFTLKNASVMTDVVNHNHHHSEHSFFQMEDPEDELLPTSKTLLDLSALDITGISMIAAACTIAVCVGVGGGGMFVPILILMLGFTTHESTGLAQALMVGGTLAGLLLNWNQRHPIANRPLIDVTMVLLLGPMQISGANVGVVVNRMLPSWLIIAFTIVVLGFTGYKTLIKGIEAYRKDCAINNAAALDKKLESSAKQKRNSSVSFAASKVANSIKTESHPPTLSLMHVKPPIPRLEILANCNGKAESSEHDKDQNPTPSTEAEISPMTNKHSPQTKPSTSRSSPQIDSLSRHRRAVSHAHDSRGSISGFMSSAQSPIAGLSDFVVTESAHRKNSAPPTSFSEAMSVFGLSDASPASLAVYSGGRQRSRHDHTPLSSYQSIMTRHHQRHHYCQHTDLHHRERASIDGVHPQQMKRRPFSIDGQVREVGDVLIVSMLPSSERSFVGFADNRSVTEQQQSSYKGGRTVIVRTCKASSLLSQSGSRLEFQSFNQNLPSCKTSELKSHEQLGTLQQHDCCNHHDQGTPPYQPCSPCPSLAASGSNSPLLKDRRLSSPTLPFPTTPLPSLPEHRINLKEGSSMMLGDSMSQSKSGYYISDETLGVLYTEQQIEKILQHLSLSSNTVETSPSIQPLTAASRPRSLTTAFPSQRHESIISPNLTPLPSHSQPKRRSSVSSMKTPVLRMLSHTPILRSFIPKNKPLPHGAVNAIYTDAMSRYVQACMTSDACIVLNCCFTDEDLLNEMQQQQEQIVMAKEKIINDQETDDHGDDDDDDDVLKWEAPLMDGKIMKFRITKLDRKVTVVGQFRVSRFEVESYEEKSTAASSSGRDHNPVVSLELVEVRPLFEKSSMYTNDVTTIQDNEDVEKGRRAMTMGRLDSPTDDDDDDGLFEPRVCALFVTQVTIGPQSQLPEPAIGIESSSDIDHDNKLLNEVIKSKDVRSSQLYKQQQGDMSFQQSSSFKFDLNGQTSSSVDVTRVISSASTADIFPSRGTSPDIHCVVPQSTTRMDKQCSSKDRQRRLSIERPFITRRASAISQRIVRILKREDSRQYDKWAILMLVWVINSGLILSKGGKTSPGLVSFCGPSYWTLLTASIVVPAVASLFIGRYVIRLTNLKLSLDVPFVEGELVYTESCVFHLLIQTFAAGIAAGVVGIGGGMILGPMMLNEGVSPQVTTAVNSTLVLFASSSAALNFMISGQADPVWSSFFFVVCFIASLIGKYLLDRVVKKYNLSSVLVFLLLFIIILSMISMIVSGVLDVAAFGFTGFSNPCA